MTAATITTAAELDALPHMSVIRDAKNWLWSNWYGEWQCGGSYGRPISSTDLVNGPQMPGGFGPFVLLHRPDVPHPIEATPDAFGCVCGRLPEGVLYVRADDPLIVAEVRERVAAEIEAEASARSYDSDEAVTEALLSAARIARGEQR